MKTIMTFFLIMTTFGLSLTAKGSVPGELESAPAGASRLLFSLAGSNTVGEDLAPAWAEAFLAAKSVDPIRAEPLATANEYRIYGRIEHERVHIDIRAHGSSTGFVSLHNHSADIAMSSRAIKPQELATLASLGDLASAAGEHVVAIDGLAVIVHPQNPVSALDIRSLALIFSGEITNWRELGGRDERITVYSRDDNSGTWDTFKSLVLGDKHQLTTEAARYESNDELSTSVAGDTGAIGFVGLASVNDSKALAVFDGETAALAPLPLHVATEDYLLARRLYLYTATHPAAIVQEFVRFCQTEAGQEIVEQIGFVAQNPLSQVVESSAGPAFYQEISRHGKRLSTNFRFQRNSAELDNKGKQDVRRLAEYLKQPHNRALRVQLIGFSDEEKTGTLADVLSRLRATAVKTELFHHGISTESVVGFGASRPVAQSPTAKTKNDRVEVWVYPTDSDAALEALRSRAESSYANLEDRAHLSSR